MIRPLRWTDLFATARGMCRWQVSGSWRSVDHEAHEAIGARSVRCHIAVPARGAREPRSHNRSFDSAARRIPSSCSSCPSWLLQWSPVVNALSSERYGSPSRRDGLTIGKTHRSPTLVHPIVRHVFHATVHCLEAGMWHRLSYHEGHEEHEGNQSTKEIRARTV